jgi:BirA family biotin operon repressor/biotin-[acetyl-CoA-carboxylase] ligase
MFTGVSADHASESAHFAGSPVGVKRPADAASAVSAARRLVAGTRFGDVRWVAETGSTNADVMALARDGLPEGVVLVADHQRAGRGRRGRTWVAPPAASLLVSLLLRPPAAVVGAVTMAVAVALAEAVEEVTGCAPRLKWPNDLVVPDPAEADSTEDEGRRRERKLAGILAEADWPPGVTAASGWRAPSPHDRVALVVGVGLNVNWPRLRPPSGRVPEPDGVVAARVPHGAVPEEVADVAASLNHLVGHEVDRVALLATFLRRLDGCYGRLVAEPSPDARAAAATQLVDRWRERSATLGRRVRVDLGSSDVEGTAVDVTAEGHLVVATDGGERRTLAAGDVVHLRPA